MTHAEFVAGYCEGRIKVDVDRDAAAKLVSQRMLLPFFLLPVLGLAVALALVGYVVAGIALFLLALGFRFLVRRSSAGYVLSQSLRDPAFFEAMTQGRVLRITS
jgi:hypothetical protein